MHTEEINCSMAELFEGHEDALEKAAKGLAEGESRGSVISRYIKPIMTRLRKNNRRYGSGTPLSPVTVLAGVEHVAKLYKACVLDKEVYEHMHKTTVSPDIMFGPHKDNLSAAMLAAFQGEPAELVAQKHIEPVFDYVLAHTDQCHIDQVRDSGHEFNAVYVAHMLIDFVERANLTAEMMGPLGVTDPGLN